MKASRTRYIRAALALASLVLIVLISRGAQGATSGLFRVGDGPGISLGSAPAGASGQAQSGSGNSITPPKQVVGPTSSLGVHSGELPAMSTGRALRDIAPKHDTVNGPIKEENDQLGVMRLPSYLNKLDPIVQKTKGDAFAPTIPSPSLSFDGMSIYTSGCNCAPPDTNGDVGPSHYIQTVNAAFQIYDKSGNSLYGPANINTLWTGVNDLCGTTNRGDPIVLYDPIGNRWLITQFAFATDSGGNKIPPFLQCMAVSQTPDPLGGYWLYDWHVNDTQSFPDYPKLGVWPLAFFMTTNNFGPSGREGPQAFAFERVPMENGASARYQWYTPLGSSHFPMIPADMDGRTQPSDGTTNLLVEFGSPQPEWKFHVDFNNIANTYLTNFYNLPVAGFTQYCFTCVPQPGTTQMLDSLSDRPLARLAYRNHGSYESLVYTHDVDVGSQHGGLRWYEIRNPYGYGSNPTIFQQGTYAPDADNRWMGSIAEDNSGDIAAVYSVSSGATYPSIRYAGRLVTDPLGAFTQGGLNFLPGSTSQVSGNRWGDYAGMVVDPTDDCTFWFTTEYNNGGDYLWYTKVGAFKFPSCAALPTYTPTPTNTPTITPTFTPTRTPTPVPTTVCDGRSNYLTTVLNAAIVPGITDTGNHCDDCTTAVALPFSWNLYDNTYSSVNVDSDGTLQFGSNGSFYNNTCLPSISHNYTIFPFWDDLNTTTGLTGCSAFTSGCGIFTSVSGSAPNRIFNIEWRAVYFSNNSNTANFEVRLYEGQSHFDVVYGATADSGATATTGVQDTGAPLFTQYTCNTASLYNGLAVAYVQLDCATTCGTANADYGITQSSGSIVAGTTDTGNHCDDCTTGIALPFTYNLYGQPFTTANVGSNGNLQFSSNSANLGSCLPNANFNNAIFGQQDDLLTSTQTGCSAFTSGCGIFTSVSGSAPNRVFNIEWRAVYYANVAQVINFEVRLYEGQSKFDVVYGRIDQGGSSASVGVQKGPGFLVSQYECGAGGLHSGLQLTFSQACPCATPSHNVLIVYADGSPPNTLRNNILAQPGVASVNLFDARGSTPTLAQLQPYDTVVVFSDNTFADATTLGNNLADYQDGGGVVVAFDFAFYNGFSILGRWQTGGYSPFNYSGTSNFSTANLGSYTVGQPLMRGIGTLTALYRTTVTTAAGAVQVALWGDSTPLLAFKARAVGVSGYVGDQAGQWSGDFGKLVVNAADWLVNAPCPTATPTFTNTPTNPPTSTPTNTPTRTGTPTNTPSSTSTPTFAPTNTPTSTRTNTPTNTPVITVTFTPTRTSTPTFTRTITPTGTPSLAGSLIGHVTWQGIAQPNAHNTGITATLSLCVSGVPQNYAVSTDASGFFTVTLNLPAGSYNWGLKAPINLGNAGTVVLVAGTNNVEFGLMKAGDCNNNNIDNTQDFTILKATFGKTVGDTGYDSRADFNRDAIVNTQDFTLQKNNFGQAGTALTCP